MTQIVLLNYALRLCVQVRGEEEVSAPGEALRAEAPGSPGRERRAAAEPSHHFTEEWVVRVPGGERHARSVAQEKGFRFVRKVRTPQHSDFGAVQTTGTKKTVVCSP